MVIRGIGTRINDMGHETTATFNVQDRQELARLSERVRMLHEEQQRIREGMVSRTEFALIQRIVYGGVGLVLAAVVGAAMTLILR